MGYHETVKSSIRTELLGDKEETVEELYSKCSSFVAGSKFGPNIKRKLVKPMSTSMRLNSVIEKLRQRDSNFVLRSDDKCIVISSTRSLQWFLSDKSDDYFLDVCFSRVINGKKSSVNFGVNFSILAIS